MTEPQINPLQSANIPPADRANSLTTIYQVSGWEIFWRNFLAGFSRALGASILYFVVFVVLAGLINYYLMPYLKPLIATLGQTVEMLNQISPPNAQNFVKPILQNSDLNKYLPQGQ